MYICYLYAEVLFGKWTEHVKSWKEADLGDRILHITYDEMVQVSQICRRVGSWSNVGVMVREAD